MPSNLFALDSELPSFTGKESPQQQIQKLYNYLFQMRQSLQYSLRNLTAENFNAAALETLTSGAKVELTEKLNLMQTALAQMSGKVDGLSARVSGVEGLSGKITALEESDELLAIEIVAMQEHVNALQSALDSLEAAVTSEGGVLTRLTEIEKKLSIIQIREDGSVTIGTEGVPLQLVGQLFINGVLYEGGTV